MNQERPKGRDEGGENNKETPRIYVASLADYNAGRLHGKWIEATQDPEEIQAEITSMLERSREPLAEEWAIHDYEGFGGLRLSEYESIERVSRIGAGIAEYGSAFAAWVGCDPDRETIEGFEDAFRGTFRSREAYADEIASDLGYDDLVEKVVPDYLRAYVRFDAEAYVRDIELSGDVTIVDAPDGSIHVYDADR